MVSQVWMHVVSVGHLSSFAQAFVTVRDVSSGTVIRYTSLVVSSPRSPAGPVVRHWP